MTMPWIARPGTVDDALAAVARLRQGKPGEHGWHYDLDVIETILRDATPPPVEPASCPTLAAHQWEATETPGYYRCRRCPATQRRAP